MLVTNDGQFVAALAQLPIKEFDGTIQLFGKLQLVKGKKIVSLVCLGG